MAGSDSEAAMAGSDSEAVMAGSNSEAVMAGSDSEAVMAGSDSEAVMAIPLGPLLMTRKTRITLLMTRVPPTTAGAGDGRPLGAPS